ncbi:MAG: hypothetical protein ACI9DG_001342 [Oleispira sp.]|jgi:hypothetical protein
MRLKKAVGVIYNEAQLTANDISLSGSKSINRGIIKANNLATLKA